MTYSILFVLAVIFCFLAGASSISVAIKYFKDGKYFLFGCEIMCLIISTILIAKLYFSI